jgi:hypothetical protein
MGSSTIQGLTVATSVEAGDKFPFANTADQDRHITANNLLSRDYGSILVTGNSSGQTLTSTTIVQTVQFDSSIRNGSVTATVGGGNSELTLADTGHYLISASITIDAPASAIVDAYIYWNGSAIAKRTAERPASAIKRTISFGAFFFNINIAAQDLELWLGTDVGGSYVINEGHLTCDRRK